MVTRSEVRRARRRLGMIGRSSDLHLHGSNVAMLLAEYDTIVAERHDLPAHAYRSDLADVMHRLVLELRHPGLPPFNVPPFEGDA